MKNNSPSNEQFNLLVRSRLFAPDFAQPERDEAFYTSRFTAQIESAIKEIASAKSAYEFNTAVAQANAFISAAHDYEFIDLAEKAKWINAVWKAVRAQKVLEA